MINYVYGGTFRLHFVHSVSVKVSHSSLPFPQSSRSWDFWLSNNLPNIHFFWWCCDDVGQWYIKTSFSAVDIDECLSVDPKLKHKCDAKYGLCFNTKGAYTCSCKPGYIGDGFHCLGKCQQLGSLSLFILGDGFHCVGKCQQWESLWLFILGVVSTV